MKYNFVYDTGFLEKIGICLTEEEKNIVFATIVGKHNAIFYGYKPERLVDAINKLTSNYPFVETSNPSTIEEDLHKSNGGILYVKNFDAWGIIDQQFLYGFSINNKERCCQFIATSAFDPFENIVPDMVNNFDIIYKCKENSALPYPSAQLANKLKDVLGYHNSLHSGSFVTSTELELDLFWLMQNAYSYLCKLVKNNPVIGHKVSMVSRSVSDCKFNSLTTLDDVHTAEYMCGLW